MVEHKLCFCIPFLATVEVPNRVGIVMINKLKCGTHYTVIAGGIQTTDNTLVGPRFVLGKIHVSCEPEVSSNPTTGENINTQSSLHTCKHIRMYVHTFIDVYSYVYPVCIPYLQYVHMQSISEYKSTYITVNVHMYICGAIVSLTNRFAMFFKCIHYNTAAFPC